MTAQSQPETFMARFGDLPEETVLGIWPYIHPNAIESFALTCQRFYHLGAKAITKHNRLRKLYGVLVNEPSRDTRLGLSKAPRSELLINLLVDIMRESRIAYYVKEFRMQYCSDCWDDIFDDAERKRETYRHLHVLSYLLEGCKYLRQQEVTEWWDQIKIGNEDPILGLLLYLLPAVRTIRFDPCTREPALCLGLIRRVAQDRKCLALSRLNEVRVEAPEPNGTEDLSALSTFANLPSVSKLIGLRIADDGDVNRGNRADQIRPDFRPKASNVKMLELRDVNLPLKTFNLLLGMFKSLQSFTYTPCSTYWQNERMYEFDSFVIRRAVALHAKDSLKTLTLVACDRKKEYMGTIHDFKSLANLTTNWGLLLPPGHIDSCTLAATLPPSIEEVTLLVDDKFNAWRGKRLIRHLLVCTRYEHPGLGDFSLKHLAVPAMEILENDKTVEIAQATGLTLRLDNTPNVISASETR